MPLTAAALATALALGGGPLAAPSAAKLTGPAAGRPPDLTLRSDVRAFPGQGPQVAARARTPAPWESGPTCIDDVCPSAVSVPGFEPRYAGRVSRNELFIAALQKARIEPLATMAWALHATGLRFDWTPPSFDSNANAHGWGSVMVRLRVRIDAQNRLVFPKRPRTG